MRSSKADCNRQRGTSLLEVLISLIILSLGLLGYAGLQSVTIKNNHNAFLRAQATSLAYNALDRMRANRANVGGYVMSTYGATPSAADAVTWKTELETTLPGGQAKITRPSGNKVIVEIKWFDSATSADSHEFKTESGI